MQVLEKGHMSTLNMSEPTITKKEVIPCLFLTPPPLELFCHFCFGQLTKIPEVNTVQSSH